MIILLLLQQFFDRDEELDFFEKHHAIKSPELVVLYGRPSYFLPPLDQWGDATITSTPYPGDFMELQNIATHELGHGFELADLNELTSPTQPLQTMFGYASPGETIKRDLASGDIAGIRALYGR